jgi:hypothetical protein
MLRGSEIKLPVEDMEEPFGCFERLVPLSTFISPQTTLSNVLCNLCESRDRLILKADCIDRFANREGPPFPFSFVYI